jgi:hypothetical protein
MQGKFSSGEVGKGGVREIRLLINLTAGGSNTQISPGGGE